MQWAAAQGFEPHSTKNSQEVGYLSLKDSVKVIFSLRNWYLIMTANGIYWVLTKISICSKKVINIVLFNPHYWPVVS